MKRNIVIAITLISMATICGCAIFTGGDNGSGDTPDISTNDTSSMEEYYDSDLTPGDNGSNLTE